MFNCQSLKNLLNVRRQECSCHDPSRRICCVVETCSIGKVCTYTQQRTVCSASSPEMNSENRKRHEITSRLLLSWIHESKTQNSRIRSNIIEVSKEVRTGTNWSGLPGKSKWHKTAAHQSPYFHRNFLPLSQGIRNQYLHLRRLPVTQFLFLRRQSFAKFFATIPLLLLSHASCCCLHSGARLRSYCFAQSHRLTFLWFYDDCVFISSVVILTRSKCNFLPIEVIFSDLWQCWSNSCWFDCFSGLGFQFIFFQFLFGIHWYHLPIFFSDFQSLCLSYILNSDLGSIQQSFSIIFHSVMLQFSEEIEWGRYSRYKAYPLNEIKSLNIIRYHLTNGINIS